MRDERREQRRARAARLIAGLLTHQGDDQLAAFLVIGSLRAAAHAPRRRLGDPILGRYLRRVSMPHAWETVSESTTSGCPPRERSWARAALVGLTIVSGRR